MYFSRQMAQSEVEPLLRVSRAPQLPSQGPFNLDDVNFRVSIFSSACTASLFMELCNRRHPGEAADGQQQQFLASGSEGSQGQPDSGGQLSVAFQQGRERRLFLAGIS